MQGIVIKRLGHNVTILEQHLSSTREGQAAGIVTMAHSHSFMNKHDLLKEQPYAISCSGVQFIDSNLKVVRAFDRPMRMASWNVLYYRFRANFDGLASAYCQNAPPESAKSGNAVYHQGKSATEIKLVDDSVVVEFQDQTVNDSKSQESLRADLVVVADGSTSHVRQLLQPHLQPTYAGYVAWRGTVPEKEVSEAARSIFQLKTTLHASSHSYIALFVPLSCLSDLMMLNCYRYTIPGENGSLEPGKRLLNYVWYTNIAEGSPDLVQAMTDSSGRRHRQTLPIGKMQKEVWATQCSLASRTLPAPFAELIHKTANPFVSAIVDIGVSKPSFFDGKVLVVGDALCPFRPHVACSTNQSSLDALLVEQLLTGEIDHTEWENRVTEYANVTRLESITWGDWYQVGYLSFLLSKGRYLLTRYGYRMSNYWRK